MRVLHEISAQHFTTLINRVIHVKRISWFDDWIESNLLAIYLLVKQADTKLNYDLNNDSLWWDRLEAKGFFLTISTS